MKCLYKGKLPTYRLPTLNISNVTQIISVNDNGMLSRSNANRQLCQKIYYSLGKYTFIIVWVNIHLLSSILINYLFISFTYSLFVSVAYFDFLYHP